MCMLIGLSIKVKLQEILPRFTKLLIQITAGSHEDEESGMDLSFFLFFCSPVLVNKQLADKERVAAAMENPRIAAVVNQCITYDPTKE